MEIENHFRDLLDVMTSEPTPRRDSSPSRHSPNVSRRTVGLSAADENLHVAEIPPAEPTELRKIMICRERTEPLEQETVKAK